MKASQQRIMSQWLGEAKRPGPRREMARAQLVGLGASVLPPLLDALRDAARTEE